MRGKSIVEESILLLSKNLYTAFVSDQLPHPAGIGTVWMLQKVLLLFLLPVAFKRSSLKF